MTSLHDSRAVPPSPRDIVARCPHRRHLRFVQRDMSLKGEGESGRDRSASAAPGRPCTPCVIRRVAGALYWRHPAHPSGGASWTPRRDSGPIPCAAGRAVSGTPRGSGQRCAKPCSPPPTSSIPCSSSTASTCAIRSRRCRDLPALRRSGGRRSGKGGGGGGPGGAALRHPASKDPIGEENYDDDGIIQRAVRALKDALPDLLVVTDVCLCEYTDHGHCGVLEPREPDAPARLRVERRDPRRPRPRLDQPRPRRRRRRRAERHDRRDGRGHPRRSRRARVRARPDHVVRRQVRLGVLRPVPGRRAGGPEVRRPAHLPDGSRKRARGAQGSRARRRGRRGLPDGPSPRWPTSTSSAGCTTHTRSCPWSRTT